MAFYHDILDVARQHVVDACASLHGSRTIEIQRIVLAGSMVSGMSDMQHGDLLLAPMHAGGKVLMDGAL